MIGGIIAVTQMSFKTEYTAPEVVTETKEVTVEINALDKAIQDAQKAQEEVIKSTAQKAYDEAYNQEMKKVELQVVTDFNKKLKERQSALEEEISL